MADADQPSGHDPETRRQQILLEKIRLGSATDGEREELALYVEEDVEKDDSLRAELRQAEGQEKLGEGWLVRAKADEQLEAYESQQKDLRMGGVGLILGGFASSLFAPTVASALVMAGLGILAASYAKKHMLVGNKDPYKDIKK